MTIPEEVLEVAGEAIAEANPHPGGGSQIVWEDAVEYARQAAPVIVAWARKEALREAEAAVRSGAIEELGSRHNAKSVEYRKGYSEGAMAAGAFIRSVTEETP